ncbi:MAG: lipid-binding SYLF domain-containing protein [Deltaproteobacteria bacterium]
MSSKIFVVMILAVMASKASAFNIERRVAVSSQVLAERMRSYQPIPRHLLNQAQCIAAMRNVKAGFIFGGEGSTGLVSCRVNGGWSAPSFLNTGGVNFGFLIGGQVVDNVLLFMTPYSRAMLSRGTLQLGGELSVAVGPLGEGIGANAIPMAHVLAYSAGTGLYAGFSLNGSVMSAGLERNRMVYGSYVTPDQILSTPATLAPAVVQPFVQLLNSYVGQPLIVQ